MIKKMSIAVALAASTFALPSCNNQPKTETTENKTEENFEVAAESFADLQLLRYQIPGFNELSLQQKTLAYYLYEAALSGRDIIYDQKSKDGILLRKTIENIYGTYSGDKSSADWKNLKNIAVDFGLAMAIIIIIAMINLCLNVRLNILQLLQKPAMQKDFL
jgi:dipeptidyl-peptidase III